MQTSVAIGDKRELWGGDVYGELVSGDGELP